MNINLLINKIRSYKKQQNNVTDCSHKSHTHTHAHTTSPFQICSNRNPCSPSHGQTLTQNTLQQTCNAVPSDSNSAQPKPVNVLAYIRGVVETFSLPPTSEPPSPKRELLS